MNDKHIANATATDTDQWVMSYVSCEVGEGGETNEV